MDSVFYGCTSISIKRNYVSSRLTYAATGARAKRGIDESVRGKSRKSQDALNATHVAVTARNATRPAK